MHVQAAWQCTVRTTVSSTIYCWHCLWPAAKGQKSKIRPVPARSPTVWCQSGAFEVTTIDANDTSLTGKVLFYVKIRVQLCGFFSLSYMKVQNVYVPHWLYYVKFVCGLMVFTSYAMAFLIVRGRRCPHRPPSSLLSLAILVVCQCRPHCQPFSSLSAVVRHCRRRLWTFT